MEISKWYFFELLKTLQQTNFIMLAPSTICIFPSMDQNSLDPHSLLSNLPSWPTVSMEENPKACSDDNEDVTMALNIGLPNHSSGSFA